MNQVVFSNKIKGRGDLVILREHSDRENPLLITTVFWWKGIDAAPLGASQ